MNILCCLLWDCSWSLTPDALMLGWTSGVLPDNYIPVLSHGRQKWLSNVHVVLLVVAGFLFCSEIFF